MLLFLFLNDMRAPSPLSPGLAAACQNEVLPALIVAPAWIGDAIMSQPLLARLQHYQPELEIDILAPAWVAPVYERMPGIGKVIPANFAHGQLALRQRYRLGRALSGRHYGRAYILPNSFKSALAPFFAGIPERIGFTGEARYGFINRRHRLDPAALPLMVERFAQLAEPPGAVLPRPLPDPELRSTPEQQATTLKALGLTTARAPIVLCPGAEYGPAKRWPARHFATLAQALAARGHDLWLLGSAKDIPIAEAIQSLAPGICRNLCGATRLDQAIDLIAHARLTVCNDSGLMHVAAATGKPLIALFGSSSPGFTPPLSKHAHIVSLQLECSPCFQRECPYGHFNCLEKLEPGRVLELCLRSF